MERRFMLIYEIMTITLKNLTFSALATTPFDYSTVQKWELFKRVLVTLSLSKIPWNDPYTLGTVLRQPAVAASSLVFETFNIHVSSPVQQWKLIYFLTKLNSQWKWLLLDSLRCLHCPIIASQGPPSNKTILLGDFRLEYDYKIEYDNDFSILVFRLHIIMTHIHLSHELPLLPKPSMKN